MTDKLKLIETLSPDDFCCKLVMASGTYWVGDPCYAVKGRERWHQWLDAAWGENSGHHRRISFAKIEDWVVVGVNTAVGDGIYQDQQNRSYTVDSGMLGVVPVELVAGVMKNMHLIVFEKMFQIRYALGVVCIGDVLIDTSPGDD